MSEKVYDIFAKVSRNYDFVNSFFSLGTIIIWRRAGASEAMLPRPSYKLLDICTGTGDLAFETYRKAKEQGKAVDITAVDFSPGMLGVAKEKRRRSGARIRFEQGDAMKLKYGSGSFDVLTSSFGLRNVDSLERFASEAYRVMRKGGKFVFMDMARPDSAVDRAFLRLYWSIIWLPGKLEDPVAYDWLVTSVNRFDKSRFASILRKAGFRNIEVRSLFSGAAFMVTGNK